MRITNQTPIPAAVVPNAEDDRVVGLFVAAATFQIVGERLVLAEQQLPLLLVVPPPGVSDGNPTKAGTSVCATGFVYAPSGQARQAAARLTVGETERGILAFGTRVWAGSLGDPTPTTPLPFDRVPMTWAHAYGGSVFRKTTLVKLASGEEAIVPQHDEACPLNFDGVGFYLERAEAIDQPLPQLEDPAAPIRSFRDQPDPVCFGPYPLHGGLRARALIGDDGKVDVARAGLALSRAAPSTTFATVPPGTRVVLEGMRPAGAALAFTVPVAPVTADVTIGAVEQRLILHVDAVDIDAEASRVRVAYRALFAYALIQHEERNLRVEASPALASMLSMTE
ncbi:MAG: DUF2169 domain-containing protein [Byssovorax sp.]